NPAPATNTSSVKEPQIWGFFVREILKTGLRFNEPNPFFTPKIQYRRRSAIYIRMKAIIK
ncbi:hypothetical protein D3M83_01840, partial [Rodentibacter pneumotropicus]